MTDREKRINETAAELTAYSEKYYGREEVLSELRRLRQQIVMKTYENTPERNERHSLHEAVKYLGDKNRIAGHPADEEFEAFSKASWKLKNMIDALESGFEGERLVAKSLETMNTEAIVLSNIGLDRGGHKSEIDYIVITSKALFIIEVKNPHKDIYISESGGYFRMGKEKRKDSPLGEKMNDRVYLVKNVLASAGIEIPVIEQLVVFTNAEIHVTNDYPYITYCFLSSLPHIIDEYKGPEKHTDNELQNMADALRGAAVVDRYPAEFDSEKYKHDFATVLTLTADEFLNTAVAEEENFDENDKTYAEEESDTEVPTPQPRKRKGTIWKILGGAIGLAGAAALAIIASARK